MEGQEPLLSPERVQLQQFKEALVDDVRAAQTVQARPGGFGLELAAAVRAEASDARVLAFLDAMADPNYRARFHDGYLAGHVVGGFEAATELVDDTRRLAKTILDFYRSVFDPVLFILGLDVLFVKRGSKSERELFDAIRARLQTFEYYQALERVIPTLPQILEEALKAAKDPGAAVGQFLIRSGADNTREFFAFTGRSREQGYFLGRVVGRASAEAFFFILDIVGLPELALGRRLLAVPRLGKSVVEAARRIPVPKAPARAREVVDEATDGVARRAARELDESTPRPFRTGPGPPAPTAATRLDRFITEIERLRLPPELQALRRDQWAEVIDFAEVNKNRFSLKGVLAEQLIESNRNFAGLHERIRRELQADPRWDLSTLQYVRRAKGKAPTRLAPGKFEDLADGLIVVKAKDRNAQQQIFIAAVIEAKSPTTTGGLVSRGGEELGQIGWDFERIRQNPIELELETAPGRRERLIYAQNAVEVSRQRTAWVIVLPRDVSLPEKQLKRLKQIVRLEPEWQHAVRDVELQRIADSIVRLAQISF